NKLLSLITTILSPCVSLALLLMNFASVGLTLAATVVNLITLFGYMIYCFNKLRLKPRFRNLDFGVLKEIIIFSAFIFLAELANMLYFATDRVLLGTMVSTTAVSVYTVGATFSNYLNSFTTGISSVLMPRVTSMVFKGAGSKEIDDVFIKVGRLQFIIVSFVISAFVVFGRQFMPIFAGEGYDDGYWIAVILMVPLAVPLIQSVAVNVVTARNKHLFRSLVLLGVAVLNVILTLIVLWFGLGGIGAAIGSACATVIGTITIMNWYYYKKMDLDIPRFWKEILKLCPIPIGMMLFGLGVTHFVDVNGAVRFLTGAVIFTIIYVPLVWITSFNEYERNLFGGVFRKLSSKFRKGTK
ncbi:MAG: oligosaccharide flippase family protein, partial [Clostridia bacterium]|nr:oligosaccharide flippase family protein [Clostridia bacterium]